MPPTPTTQNGQNEIIRLWGHQLGPKGDVTLTIQIAHSQPPVDRELTPTTQIGQNEKVEFLRHHFDLSR